MFERQNSLFQSFASEAVIVEPFFVPPARDVSEDCLKGHGHRLVYTIDCVLANQLLFLFAVIHGTTSFVTSNLL